MRLVRGWFVRALLFSFALAPVAPADPYSGDYDCNNSPLGPGVPGGAYAFILEKQVDSPETCASLVTDVQAAVLGAFDDGTVYLQRSAGCAQSSDRPTATVSFHYVMEAWSADRLNDAHKQLQQIDGKAVDGIVIRFKPVTQIESRNTVSLLTPANGQDEGDQGGAELEAEVPLYQKAIAPTRFSSLIQWCQAPAVAQSVLGQSDFGPTEKLLKEALGDAELGGLEALLPQASAIEIDYSPSLQLDTGRRIEASFGRFARRDCRKLSCGNGN